VVHGEDQVALLLGKLQLPKEAGVVVGARTDDQRAPRIDVADGGAELAQVAVPYRVERQLRL
jgi:hypothetical protein